MRKIRAPYTDPTDLFRHGGAACADREGMLDFSASINPLGPPRSVLKAIRASLKYIVHYPDPREVDLAAALARQDRVKVLQVVPGNGSSELIHTIAQVLRPRKVAIAEPTFTEYLRASLQVAATVDHWLGEGEHFELAPFDPEGADLVWLCNPNNPTGAFWPPGRQLSEWMNSHPQTTFVVDEAFMPFCEPDEVHPLLPYLDRTPNLILLRSLTKLYALPGLRVGYAVTSVERAAQLRAGLPAWNVNCLAQAAAVAALQDDSYRLRTHRWSNGEMLFLGGLLSNLDGGLVAVSTRTNFALARCTRMAAAKLVLRLREHGILIRDASNFVGLGDRHVRISIRTAPENQRLFDALAAVLQG